MPTIFFIHLLLIIACTAILDFVFTKKISAQNLWIACMAFASFWITGLFLYLSIGIRIVRSAAALYIFPAMFLLSLFVSPYLIARLKRSLAFKEGKTVG